MKLLRTALPDVVVVETSSTKDHRGAFSRLFCSRELSTVIGERHIVQINYSLTSRVGAVRGLHFQCPPHAEMKLVRCIKGRVFDVAVDLRTGSPTFCKWHAEELTPGNARLLLIPEGFAHGFQTLEAQSELLYLHTSHYEPKAENGVCFDDPRLDISWPLPVTDISERDRLLPALGKNFFGISI